MNDAANGRNCRDLLCRHLAVLTMLTLMSPIEAIADTRCVTLNSAVLANACQDCVEVSVRELRPREQQVQGMYTGQSQSVRLEGGSNHQLGGTGSWLISSIEACRPQ